LYLESWIHFIVKTTLENDADFRRFANKSDPTTITRSDIEIYQTYRLRRILRYCSEKSSFYREVLRARAIQPDYIRDLGDLAGLPFTEPYHLAESPYRFLCISQAEIARPYTFITSGTTGPKKKIFWTHNDIERITDFMAAGIGTVAEQKDIVLILLPDGRPNSQADLLCKGVKKLRATPAVAEADLNASELLKAVQDSHCTVIFGYARKLWRLSQELRLQKDLSALGVRVLFLASEYLPPAMRHSLQKAWNCSVRTHYGLTEMGMGVAVECEACDGYHFNEAELLLEVVNPQTGEAVANGEEGELVFTTLTREAMPLIRYRTHDLSRLITEPCPCGASSLLKFAPVKKRLENIVMVGENDEMYPVLFDDVLFAIPGLVDYQVTVTREEGKDRLDFRIELLSAAGDVSEIEKKLLLAPIIAKNLAAGKMAPPRVEFANRGELRSISRAKRMILDRR
jgi:phenylacetate-CoA ligase